MSANDPIRPEDHPELFEREEVYQGSPGSYGVAIVVAALTVFFLMLLLTGCGYGDDGVDAFGWTNTGDPRVGKVEVSDYSYKMCDGTTLIYGGSTTGVVINSEECQP